MFAIGTLGVLPISQSSIAFAAEQLALEQRDLAAQESMAEAAWWMVLASVVAVVLNALTLWAIVKTLKHTGDAARSAADMLKKAETTNELARATIYAQARPKLRAGRVEVLTGPDGLVTGTFQVSNEGAYTCNIIYQLAHFQVCEESLPTIPEHSTGRLGWREEHLCRLRVEPNGWAQPSSVRFEEKNFSVVQVPDARALARVKASTAKLFIVGVIDYEPEKFPYIEAVPQHRTAFAREVLWSKGKWQVKAVDDREYEYQT